jgi:hypothetical protein
LARDHTSTSRYLFARDLAFFSVDFYSGDRASGQIMPDAF